MLLCCRCYCRCRFGCRHCLCIARLPRHLPFLGRRGCRCLVGCLPGCLCGLLALPGSQGVIIICRCCSSRPGLPAKFLGLPPCPGQRSFSRRLGRRLLLRQVLRRGRARRMGAVWATQQQHLGSTGWSARLLRSRSSRQQHTPCNLAVFNTQSRAQAFPPPAGSVGPWQSGPVHS